MSISKLQKWEINLTTTVACFIYLFHKRWSSNGNEWQLTNSENILSPFNLFFFSLAAMFTKSFFLITCLT